MSSWTSLKILFRPSAGWPADMVSVLKPHGRDQLVRRALHAMLAVAASAIAAAVG